MLSIFLLFVQRYGQRECLWRAMYDMMSTPGRAALSNLPLQFRVDWLLGTEWASSARECMEVA